MQRQELAVWRKLSEKEPRQPITAIGLVDCLARLARTLLAEGRFSDAETLAREAGRACEKDLPDDWHAFNARSLLGGSFLGQKKFPEAEPLLLSGFEGMKKLEAKMMPDDKPCLKEALQRVVSFYEAAGKSEQAMEWKKRLEAK